MILTWFYLALISAVLSSASAIVQKKVLSKLDALDFSFILSLISLLLCVPFFFISGGNGVTPINLAVLFFKTILAGLAFWSVMLTLKNLDISGALPLLAITPGFTAVLAFFVLFEPLKIHEMIGIFLLILGSYALEVPDSKKLLEPIKILVKSKKYKYVLYAVFLFALSSVLDKALLKNFKMPPDSLMAYHHLFFFIFFLAAIIIMRRIPDVKIAISSGKAIWIGIVVVAVMTIGYRYTLILATKAAPAVALVLAVKRISVFFASVIGGRIFKEKHLLKRALAAAIIIMGAILIAKE